MADPILPEFTGRFLPEDFARIGSRTGDLGLQSSIQAAYGDVLSSGLPSVLQTAPPVITPPPGAAPAPALAPAAAPPNVDQRVQRTLSSALQPVATEFTEELRDYLAGDFEPYQGQLVAGPTALEQQAWSGLSGLAMPSNVMGDVVGKLGGVFDKYLAGPQYYTPADYSSLDFQRPEAYVPGALGAQYVAPEAYAPTTFESRLAGFTPGAYQATQFADPYDYTAREIQTGLGPVKSVEGYMNPYVQNVVDVQSREARRNAAIKAQEEAARFAKSAAFGGGRQAIVESEASRNLATLLDEITAKGYSTAYDKAQAQRLAEAARFQEAQTATAAGERAVASDQARFNLEAAGMSEASKQFGFNKEIDWARLLAGDALEAQKLSEQSKQFGYGQQMTVADRAVDAEIRIYQAQEAARQQATRLGVDVEKAVFDAGLAALQASDASEKDKERLGLEYLTGARGAASDIVNLYGAKQAQAIALAQAQAAAGKEQRGISQAELDLQRTEFEKWRDAETTRLKTATEAFKPLAASMYEENTWGAAMPSDPAAVAAAYALMVSQATANQATGNQATGNQATGNQATGNQAAGNQAAGNTAIVSNPAAQNPLSVQGGTDPGNIGPFA